MIIDKLYIGDASMPPSSCVRACMGGRGHRALPLRLPSDVRAFGWGYASDARKGYGPAALARVLLEDATGNAELAKRHAPRFEACVIAQLNPADGWRMRQAGILAWIATEERQQALAGL